MGGSEGMVAAGVGCGGVHGGDAVRCGADGRGDVVDEGSWPRCFVYVFPVPRRVNDAEGVIRSEISRLRMRSSLTSRMGHDVSERDELECANARRDA
ncbi:hypothetical protein MRB53_040777 [Persea americana]|nr:hypothetical protein MRB53_040777 [Persea americana]